MTWRIELGSKISSGCIAMFTPNMPIAALCGSKFSPAPFLKGASHIFWLSSYDAAVPPIDDFGPTVVFEEAFDGEQGIGIGFQPAASRLTKKYGMHPFLSVAGGNKLSEGKPEKLAGRQPTLGPKRMSIGGGASPPIWNIGQ